jgi:crossover junction endodeoxyribonuclease RusA
MIRIALPWPDRRLSSNARVHYMTKHKMTRAHRVRAGWAALSAPINAPADGDIVVRVTFNPPSRRGDRANMPHLIKAYLDGLADGWKVNDRRFLPQYIYGEPVRGGCVTFEVG